MTYLARQSIIEACYLSGIVSRSFSTVTGEMGRDGLNILNDFLSEKTADEREIPFRRKFTFNTVVGTSNYFVQDLITPETITFFDGTTRLSSMDMTIKTFAGAPNTPTSSMPCFSHFEKEVGGCRIYFFYSPDKAYSIEIHGKGRFPVVNFDTDLSLILDRFYINYLIHEVAFGLCAKYGLSMKEEVNAHLSMLRSKIYDMTPMDITFQQRPSIFDNKRQMYLW